MKGRITGKSPIVIAVLFMTLQIVCYTWILQTNYSKDTLESAIERNTLRMDSVNDSVSGAFDDDDFTSITAEEDMESERYIAFQENLNSIREMKNLRYLYTAGRNEEGNLVYLIDGLDMSVDDFACPGTVIEDEMIPYIEDALKGEKSYTDKIIDTSWGHIYAACYPVYSKEKPNKVVGALCMELDMESTYSEIEKNNKKAVIAALVAIIITSLLTIMAFMWMRWVNKREIQQRNELDEAYEKAAKTNFELEQARRDMEKALHAAETANRAKTDFLSKMSHDIRTPLNGIMGLLEMDERHPDNKELIEENRGKIKVAASHLNSLLNDILQLSKLENGDVELAQEVFDMNVLAEEIITITAIEAEERGIKFNHGDCREKIEAPYVYGSPLHLRKIFLNIFSNAIKYNKPGGSISCSITCESVDDDTVEYSCTVSDTGIGMNSEFLEHIFEPFSQEHSDARSTYQGTGLGMAIVKTLVDRMNGTVEIDSEEGVGTTFVVTIPFKIAEESEIRVDEADDSEVSIENLMILLVEDNELNMEIAQLLLEDAGAVVTKAFDGRQAADIFAGNPAGTFDVILMDVMMPVMNGIEAAKVIRMMDSEDASTIPIIAMTANAFEEDRQATKDAGMNAHLSKPLDSREVLRTIVKYVNK
ncbi:MAG: ATP-binding protein [Firmicutes bacterium]|nr:ATP-binding protein [Bacillota bacterium]